jgi:mono/diheme cytochrome c family protein
LIVVVAAFALAADRAPVAPTDPKNKISYTKQIQPILQQSCAKCHLNGKRKGGLALDTRDDILKGGESGAVVDPHNPDESSLITLLTINDEDSRMPKNKPPLPKEQVALLTEWVKQGMPYDDAAKTATTRFVAQVAPRKVDVPEVAGVTNPIDRVLASYLKQNGVSAEKLVDDRTFARRVYMDTVGLVPSPQEVAQFESDQRPDKREKLVETLLGDNRRYAENWLSFWNDALRNDYEGPGYIDGGRQQITPWLYEALEANKPYDQFVRELVAPPTAASEGFVKGILWRGAVSASQIRELQAAQNISQVFLGINMKCASCHDSFTSDWKLNDAYGLAGVFAEKPLQVYRCEKDTGKVAPIKFVYLELGSIDANATRVQRQQQLAELLTSEKNGRFARTIVNRVWAKLMGRGIVEPVDEMDREPWNADLLDWLANDLVTNKYDLKKTMARIMTSRAYQLPPTAMREREEKFAFAGPVVRRLSAEQFYDALSTLTGVWQDKPAAKALECRPLQLPAKWVWASAKANESAPEETIFLRKVIELSDAPDEALATIACDNGFELLINGKTAAKGEDFTKPKVVDLKKHLKRGTNVVAVVAQNFRPDLSKPPRKNPATLPQSKVSNPAGFLMIASARVGEKLVNFDSGASWKVSREESEGWASSSSFDASAWKPAAELGAVEMGPWNVLAKIEGVAKKKKFTLQYDQLRAVWARNDALMTALGRPNRERVVTHRDSPATMLQLLELTNGATITRIVTEGGKRWADEGSTDEILVQMYARALNRRPTEKEMEMGRKLVGTPAKAEGIADVVWSITMLPEFQLVY